MGGDSRWSVSVNFDSERFNRSGPVPVSSLQEVSDPPPDRIVPQVGDCIWHREHGYGILFLSPSEDLARRLGLSVYGSWVTGFFYEEPGRFVSVYGPSVEFASPGKGFDGGQISPALQESIISHLRWAIAQIPDSLSDSEAERLQGYLNARISWVKSLIGGDDADDDADYSPGGDDADDDADYSPGVDDADDADYSPGGDDDADDDADYLPSGGDADDADYSPGGDDDADDDADYLPSGGDDGGELGSLLVLLPGFLAEANSPVDLFRVLNIVVAALRERGVSTSVIVHEIS